MNIRTLVGFGLAVLASELLAAELAPIDRFGPSTSVSNFTLLSGPKLQSPPGQPAPGHRWVAVKPGKAESKDTSQPAVLPDANPKTRAPTRAPTAPLEFNQGLPELKLLIQSRT